MEQTPFLEVLNKTWQDIVLFVEGLARPYQFYQLIIIFASLLIARFIARYPARRLNEWTRSLEGRQKWELRYLLELEKRVWLIVWAIMLWGIYLMMHEVTWPSRSFLIHMTARLATAWMIVGFVTRLIHNRFLRRIVKWVLWIGATLYVVGLYDGAVNILESIAIEIGAFRLSLLTILKALVVTGILFAAARVFSAQFATRIRQNEDLSPSARELLIKTIRIVLFALAFFVGLKAVGFDLTGLTVLSGAIGLGLGFGLQKVVSNLVSGVIILLDKSIKPGDVITLGDTFGWINTLGARYTSVVTRDGKEYLIPNEDMITNQVVNWSHSNAYVRLDIYFGTAYSDDPHLVRKIAVEAASGVSRVSRDRPAVCHVVGFGDSSVDYILRFWIIDPSGGLTNVRGAVYLALWDAFKENNISIPFPQREVKVVEGSTLSTKALD